MNQLQHKYTLHLNNHLLHVRISKNFEQHRYEWISSRHCNAEYELHIILKGRIPFEIEDKQIILEARQGILISPGQYHAPLQTTGEFDHFSLSFTPSNNDLADILQNEIPNHRIFSISADMLQECHMIYRECSIGSVYRNAKIHALLTSLMISVLLRLNLDSKSTVALSATELERAEIIDEFFSEHLNNHQGAMHLAQQLHISERQLNRILYQLYGMTFQEKMTHAKMDRAAWLLRTSNKKIIEVAESVGYSSEAAFYQAFRKYYQITPKKYRTHKK